MQRPLFGLLLSLMFLTVWVASTIRAGEGDADSGDLTNVERTLVRTLSEQALQGKGLFKGKVFLTSAEVFVDNSRGRPVRFVLVQHYGYDGDVTLQTSINLDRKEVLGVEALPHCPTPLSPEELAEAEKLARANPVVKRALARQKGPVEVDAQMYFPAPDQPTYQHRMVRLLFRQGRRYLLNCPAADVDLTAGTVRADPVAKTHD
jgi:hypothetical protein